MIKSINSFKYGATVLAAGALLAIAPATAFAEDSEPSDDSTIVTVPPVWSGAGLSRSAGLPTPGRPVFERAPLLIAVP